MGLPSRPLRARLCDLALRAYPPAWRQRYGAEMARLLEDTGPSWARGTDLLLGAFTARLETWSGAAPANPLARILAHLLTAIVVAVGLRFTMALMMFGVTWILGPWLAPLRGGFGFRELIAPVFGYGTWAVTLAAPFAWSLWLTGIGRRWPRAARAVFLVAFSMIGFWLEWPTMLLWLWPAGWVLAHGVFPTARPRPAVR